jgi:nucleotide-binding universal stress UspA family protein
VKTILVPVGGTTADQVVFETAHAAARPFHAHLEFFHVRIGAAEAALTTPHAGFARGAALPAMLHKLASDAEARATSAKHGFTAFCRSQAIEIADAPSPSAAVSANWREESDDAMRRLMFQARRHDLVVLGRARGPNGLSPDFAEQLLLGCGRPLLVVPSKPRHTLTETVMVCWKESAESARAVTAALPFLETARRVVIAGVQENDTRNDEGIEALAHQLRWHVAETRTVFIADDRRPAHAVLMETAHACNADLLVMGGYGRSRARELIFGGVTQFVLDGADLPVFLFH